MAVFHHSLTSADFLEQYCKSSTVNTNLHSIHIFSTYNQNWVLSHGHPSQLNGTSQLEGPIFQIAFVYNINSMFHWSREVVLLAICHNPVNPQYPPRLGVRITCFLYFLSSYGNVLECVKNCFKKIKPYCSLTLKMFCLIRKYVNLRMCGNYLKSVTSYIKSLNPPFSPSLRCIDLITAFKVAPFDKMSRYF